MGSDHDDRESVRRDFERYRETRDRDLRNRLVERHRWIAERGASRFRDRGEPEADLIQVAQLALVKAAERYDPSLGVSFPSYAMPTVVGELKRHFRDSTWAVAVPRRCKDLLVPMNAAIESLRHRLGRAPTVDEVAAELHVDREQVVETIEAGKVYRSSSIDSSRSHDGDTLAALLSGADDPTLERSEQRIALRAAFEGLDERSRSIVHWRYFEERTQSEIGERLGISQVQVSRLLRAALERMASTLGPAVLADRDR